MEKKYHDLIVSLIKENRKYPGYEAILEDIVEDVYAHSRVVIESVTNEDVVTAYLNKVISTSIITVPKKMNFRHRVKRLSPVIPQPSPVAKATVVEVGPEPVVENEIIEKPAVTSEPDTLSLEINDEPQVTNEIENSPVVEKSADSYLLAEEELDFETETVTLDAAPIVEPQAFTFEEEGEEPVAEESTPEPEESASVEDNADTWEMVSEPLNIVVEEPEVSESLDLEESFSEPEAEAVQEIPDVAAAIEEEFIPEPAVEPSLDKSLVDKMINGVSDTIEPVAQPEPVLEDEVVDESIPDAAEPLSMLLEENRSEDALILEESAPTDDLILQEEVLMEETPDILEESKEEEPMSLDLSDSVENTVLVETDEDTEELSLEMESSEPVILSESVDDTSVEAFSMPSFKCFDYEPEIEEFDAEEICSELKDMDTKHPERKVLQVCDLKYSKKMSVPDIAAELGLNQEDVIETLYEIIDVVKD